MKPFIPFALLSAIFAIGAASAATTTPVGYYQFDGKAGGNLFVPGFVNSPKYAGVISSSTATTLTIAASSFAAGAFDSSGFATHYVEITSGPRAGVVVDVASNTASVITLASGIGSLGLVGGESFVVRAHVTLKSALANGEAGFGAFSDSATFYGSDGSITTYVYDGAGNWTSDFTSPDGNNRPIPPATGFVLGLTAASKFAVVGEVKSGSTVVQLKGGVVNIVGPVNPLVGEASQLSQIGFAGLAAYSDSFTAYEPGSLSIVDTYLADGAGNVIDGTFSPTDATISHTVGGVVTAATDTAIEISSGL